MNDDQLRDRIGRLDPLAHSDIDGTSDHPITSPEARSLLETVMNSPLSEVSDTQPLDLQPRTPRRWMALAGAAAAAVAVLAVGAIALTGGDDDPDVAAPIATDDSEPDTGKLTVLELSSGNDDIMASCMVVDASMIAQSQVAFKGTVTMAENGVVQLLVDKAYVGMDEQAVTLSAPEGMEALIGGVEWEVGSAYLVTAWDGVVNYCGQTGPATPELQAIYDEAFPS